MRHFLTDSVVLTRTIFEVAASAGVPPEPLLACVGLTAAQLADPETRVPAWRHIRLLNEAVRLTGDDYLGLHAGASLKMNTPHVQHYLFFNSPNLREGILRSRRYNRLLSTAGRLLVEETGKQVMLGLATFIPLPAMPRQAAEWGLAMVAGMVLHAAPAGFHFQEAHFQHREPKGCDRQVYEEILGCPVHFGRRGPRLFFDSRWMDEPCINHNPALLPVLEQLAEQQLSRVFPDDLAEAVRGEIKHSLVLEAPTINALGARLGMHPRTLQRRLVEQGTSYKDILDGVRQDIAESLLREPKLSIADMSFLLGYAEVGAFYRAFRRWHGTTPADYREHIAHSAGAEGGAAPPG